MHSNLYYVSPLRYTFVSENVHAPLVGVLKSKFLFMYTLFAQHISKQEFAIYTHVILLFLCIRFHSNTFQMIFLVSWCMTLQMYMNFFASHSHYVWHCLVFIFFRWCYGFASFQLHMERKVEHVVRELFGVFSSSAIALRCL